MTAICHICGLDCWSPMALQKHTEKGDCKPKYEFFDRHDNDVDLSGLKEKCPKCLDVWADFWIKDEDTFVCLACGAHFTPKRRLNEINEWKLGRPKFSRNKQA